MWTFKSIENNLSLIWTFKSTESKGTIWTLASIESPHTIWTFKSTKNKCTIWTFKSSEIAHTNLVDKEWLSENQHIIWTFKLCRNICQKEKKQPVWALQGGKKKSHALKQSEMSV